MPVFTMKPVPLAAFKTLMKRFSYDCILDQHPVLQFKKDGNIPAGYEQVAASWPEILTVRHPDFAHEKFVDPVYDSSQVIDILLSILHSSSPTMTRTEVSIQISAILKPRIVS